MFCDASSRLDQEKPRGNEKRKGVRRVYMLISSTVSVYWCLRAPSGTKFREEARGLVGMGAPGS